ncbi:unnamed protein product [Owenia fusiformis]|uniref:SUEL-type lectin domain-containing protein n=1 Tax=Owenia fusiformis TaxID=6347 RepID=A0A8S4NLJ1_OWEFU|nr:unnamed protein product [Owenia fusiformis]
MNSWFYRDTACTSEDKTFPLLKKWCNGKNKCIVDSLRIKGIVGDPCEMIHKYVEIEWKCKSKVDKVCNGPSGEKSVSSPQLTQSFDNKLSTSVVLIWVNSKGIADPVHRWVIPPGGRKVLTTYSKHYFVAQTVSTAKWLKIKGKCLYVPKGGVVDITY